MGHRRSRERARIGRAAIDRLTEYPYANGWKGFDGMRELDGRRMVPPDHMPRLPLMYAIAAHREAA